MAATAQLAAVKRTPNLIALWHLLSLDAPTVAALWTWFVARANHIDLPLASPAAMALAVWILYAADRLLDARILNVHLLDARLSDGRTLDRFSPRSLRHLELESRHIFHHQHRRAFWSAIAIASVVLASLLPRLDPAAIRLYVTEGTLLFTWFLILHATRSAHRLPKELAVGLFFAAATFIPTVSRQPFAGDPELRLALLPPAALFAAVCSLNCLFIFCWEHPSPTRVSTLQPHPTTRIALRHLTAISLVIAFTGGMLTFFYSASARTLPAACALSALLLLTLDRRCRDLSAETLRAAADLVLLTPLLFLPFTR